MSGHRIGAVQPPSAHQINRFIGKHETLEDYFKRCTRLTPGRHEGYVPGTWVLTGRTMSSEARQGTITGVGGRTVEGVPSHFDELIADGLFAPRRWYQLPVLDRVFPFWRAWWERRNKPLVEVRGSIGETPYVHHPRCSLDHLGACVFLDPQPSHLEVVPRNE